MVSSNCFKQHLFQHLPPHTFTSALELALTKLFMLHLSTFLANSWLHSFQKNARGIFSVEDKLQNGSLQTDLLFKTKKVSRVQTLDIDSALL